jgi:hypothetical protein
MFIYCIEDIKKVGCIFVMTYYVYKKYRNILGYSRMSKYTPYQFAATKLASKRRVSEPTLLIISLETYWL